MEFKFTIDYKKMLSNKIYGGSAFPSGSLYKDEEEESDIEYIYSDSEDSSESSNLLDEQPILSLKEIKEDEKEDELKKILLNKHLEWSKSKNPDKNYQKEYLKIKYLNKLIVINLNSNIGGDLLLWNKNNKNYKKTLTRDISMTMEEFADELSNIDEEKSNKIINKLKEDVNIWKKNGGTPPILDYYLSLFSQIDESNNNSLKSEKLDDIKNNEDDLENLLKEMDNLKTRIEIGRYLEENNINMSELRYKVMTRNELNLTNLFNSILKKK